MRKRLWVLIFAIVISLMPIILTANETHAQTLVNLHTGIATNTITGQSTILNSANLSNLSNDNSAAVTTITGQLFDNANAPIGNYMFDADGFQGNFDIAYWLSNIIFLVSAITMFFALNFYHIGAGANSLNGLITVVLKILHQGFIGLAVPLLPLAVIMLIGVFLWFGFIKKDLPSVFGRAVKTMAVFILIAFISSPTVANSTLVQNISQFPVTMGDWAGGLIEKVLETAITQKGTTVLTGSVENQAWESIVLNEWISGEEGQNYSATGQPESNLEAGDAAWRQSLAEPLQGSNRNQIASTLEKTPDGPTAFSGGNRFVVATTSAVGNIGPVIYFFVIGLILLGAKIMFLVLVAAGAVILPLELFPVTRSATLALKWIQLMAMTLFVTFYLTVYSSFLFGLSNDATAAIQDSGEFGGSLSSFFFLVQGVVYLAAIYVAWKVYQRMKPMQRIKTMTERAAKRGVPLGWGQRLTTEARRANQWEKRAVTKKTLGGSDDSKKKPSIISRAADVAKGGVAGAWGDRKEAEEDILGDFDHDGYDSYGFDRDGYDRDGFNRSGKDRGGYNREGRDSDGFWRGFNTGEPVTVVDDNGNTVPWNPPDADEPEIERVSIEGSDSLARRESPSSREFKRMNSTVDDDPFFASEVAVDAADTVIDIDPPSFNEKGAEWLKQANALEQERSKPPVRRGEKLSDPSLDNDTIATIDKWTSRAEKIKSFAGTMRSPDTAMDALMGVTLGKAANKISSVSNKAALAAIWHVAKGYETRKLNKANRPAEVKRQTDPASKRSRVKVETPKDTTSWYGEWQKQNRQQDQPGESTTSARPEKPAPEPTISRPRLTIGGGEGSASRLTEAPIKPSPVMRMKGATVTQISATHHRSRENRVKRVKRLAKYTQPTLPKVEKPNRPNLRKKNGPSLTERIFGDKR